MNFITKVYRCQLDSATLIAVGACSGGEDKDFGSFPKESSGGSNKI